jgi:hypothetical protein
VVAGFHCRLEVLPGFEFLSCCQHSESEKSPTHHARECTDDGCAAVELGFYKPEKLDDAPVMPLLALVIQPSLLPEPDLVSAFDRLVSISSSPPELSQVWRFSQRTALPPRAPSSVS